MNKRATPAVPRYMAVINDILECCYFVREGRPVSLVVVLRHTCAPAVFADALQQSADWFRQRDAA